MENRGSVTGQARGWKETAGDAAARAQDVATRVAARAGGYVQDALERAGGKVEEMTGRPIGGWTADVQRYLRSHPLQTAVIALGIGYIVGRLIRRR